MSGSVRAGERVDSAHGRQRDDPMQRESGDVVLFLSTQSVDRRRRQLLAELVIGVHVLLLLLFYYN